MIFDWNEEKNSQLKQERNIGFEQIVIAIDEGAVLDICKHPNQEKYKNQYLIIVEINSYAYVIPSAVDEEYWFLKTIYPSRRHTKLYLKDKSGGGKNGK